MDIGVLKYRLLIYKLQGKIYGDALARDCCRAWIGIQDIAETSLSIPT